MRQLSPGLKIAGVYVLIGGLWIFASDIVLSRLFADSALLTQYQVLKGWLFILFTGAVLYYLISRELAHRQRLEARGEEAEAQLRMLASALEQSNEAITITTAQLERPGPQIVFVNPAFTRLTGYTAQEVLGKTPRILQGRRTDRRVLNELRERLSRGEAFYGRLINYRKDRSEIIKELHISPVRDSRGVITNFVAVHHDITRQVEIESQLRYQADLLQNVSDAIISTDMEMVIRTWNHAAEKIYGWTEAEALGQRLDHLVEITSATTSENTLEQIRQTGFWQGELTEKNKAGEALTILTSANILLDAEGRPVGIVSINRDITRARQMEAELRQAEAARLALQKEKELLDMKEQFISMVSHEFRTPLTTVVTSTDLIEHYYDRLSEEKRHQHLQKIRSQTDYMRKLLDNVLTVSKAQAGKVSLDPQPLDLGAYCEKIVDEMRFADPQGHEIILTTAGNLQAACLDESHLRHILVNLLSNALKYSPEGSTVRIEAIAQEDDLILKVSDQGIGIPEEDQAQLFTPFRRARNTGSVNGTGLGLAIVKNSVELHGGTISLQSKVGEGTTFSVHLPLKSQNVPE